MEAFSKCPFKYCPSLSTFSVLLVLTGVFEILFFSIYCSWRKVNGAAPSLAWSVICQHPFFPMCFVVTYLAGMSATMRLIFMVTVTGFFFTVRSETFSFHITLTSFFSIFFNLLDPIEFFMYYCSLFSD